MHVSRVAAAGALAIIGVGIPLTFSRAAVLAVVPMVVLWCVRRPSRLAAGALAGGLALGVVLGIGGIDAKAERTLDADSADSGRRERLAEAWRLMEREPIFGVGPGRYVLELRHVEREEVLPAHNVVAQAAAETGVPGGALMLATLAAFSAWLLRRRPMTIAVGISLLPFHLLDSYPHVFPVGLVITGFWLMTLATAAQSETRRADDPAGAGGSSQR